MSGRLSNGWGECVWCGEILKPEDQDKYADRCPFCLKWNKMIQLVINRMYYSKKQSSQNDSQTEQAKTYWQHKENTYRQIHKNLIDVLNIKKQKLYGESY